MKQYLVVGAQGQLGWELVRQLERAGREVVGLGRNDCDVATIASVRGALQAHQPEVVFNAAAYNAVDDAEREADEAFRVNALGAGNVARACREIEARLIHFSTDYVFGHGHASAIDESETPAPLSQYARSKWQGEKLVARNLRESFVIRTTGLYSHRRHNFVHTMVKHGLAGTDLTVVDDEFMSPTWVRPLAEVAIELSHTDLYGTYHAVAHGDCSWHEFAGAIFEILDIDANLSPTTADEWNAPARRPEYSALDNRMLRMVGIDEFKNWRPMLETFLDEYGDEIIAKFAPADS